MGYPRNCTVITNFRDDGFACTRNCHYCNWKEHPLLPKGMQDLDVIYEYVCECEKEFVTVSGGGDPFYDIESLKKVSDVIRVAGKRVRVISREIQKISENRNLFDSLSVSLDNKVLKDLEKYYVGRADFSLVMPPTTTDELLTLFPTYQQTAKRVPGKLVLRENLLSVFDLDWDELCANNREFLFVPKSLCLGASYLIDKNYEGYQLYNDEADVFQTILQVGGNIFGGAARHYLAPKQNLHFSDYDVLFVKPEDGSEHLLFTELARFGYTFKQLAGKKYPVYYHGSTDRQGKPITLIQMTSQADIERFVFNAQYCCDRFYIDKEGEAFDGSVGADAVMADIRGKVLRKLDQPDKGLFMDSSARAKVEARHEQKMLAKGYKHA